MVFLRSALLHLFALAVLCVGSAISSPQELRVLFIGNSLTYSHDLPAIVAALAETSQQKRFVYKTIAFPDFSLEDHWKQGEAQKAMTKDKWDFVVLQQGPSGLPESRELLIKYTHLFAEKIHAAGARPALYQVWPSATRFNDFPRVLEAYQIAAKAVNGLLLPVGAAWLSAWNRDASLKLYAEDQFHPSEIGSYLAALVLYEKLFATPPSRVPTNLQYKSKKKAKIAVTKEQALTLQTAAAAATKQF